jgi:hypothetical protein
MIKCGLCLRSNHEPRHIYVVVTDPDVNDDILLVNFTSLENSIVETAEVFNRSDYSLLSHDSVIAYWKAPAGAKGPPLEQAILNGDFGRLPDIPIATLERIIAEARTSNHLSSAQKRLLPPPDRGQLHDVINYDE